MATVTERIGNVEDRTDRLETTFAWFMERTEQILARMEAAATQGREEAAQGRQEAAQARQEAARDRQAMRDDAVRAQEEMNKRWGELANKMGTVVEDIVAPSVRRLARELFDCGDEVLFSPRLSRRHPQDRSRTREFDALYVGTRAVLLNETKSSPRSSDGRKFAEFVRRGEFAQYFPEWAELTIVPVFSSLSIPPDMVTYLTRQGIFALGMGPTAMQVLNLDAVQRRHAS